MTKNYSNISASQSENIDKNKNFVLGKFLSTGLSVYSGDEIIKRHFSAYQSEENMLQTILLPKLKQFPEKNIYDIEREIVKNFLKNISIIPDEIRDENTKNILKYQKKFVTEDEYRHAKNIFLNDENFELTLYIRYKHCVDYPDIAEFVGIFLDEYISSGRSKIFKNLRILPRNDMAEVNISPFIKSLKSAKYYNVVGLDASAVMNIFATTFYLSHSANA